MRIGIDLGNTEIEVLALADDGKPLMRERVPTAGARYEELLDTIKSLVALAEHQNGVQGTVGVGLPGAISAKTGLLKNSNSAYLIGTNFVTDISQKLGREVRIGNDANCFTLAEAVDGAAAGAHVVFGLILDTGVGAGIVIGQTILEGANAVAGELGHNPLPWSSDEESARVRCYCGKYGCIEQFLSIPGLQRAYKLHSGLFVSIDEIARAAGARDDKVARCLTEYESRLARSLASVINLIDPDVIVIGGGLAKVPMSYASLHEAVARYAFTDRLDTKIVAANHGDSATARGAAMLWPG
jgi:fructokinase